VTTGPAIWEGNGYGYGYVNQGGRDGSLGGEGGKPWGRFIARNIPVYDLLTRSTFAQLEIMLNFIVTFPNGERLQSETYKQPGRNNGDRNTHQNKRTHTTQSKVSAPHNQGGRGPWLELP
jgi:hypothetical protein